MTNIIQQRNNLRTALYLYDQRNHFLVAAHKLMCKVQEDWGAVRMIEAMLARWNDINSAVETAGTGEQSK